MKNIKLLLVFAIFSLVVISCKETKKEEVKDAVEETTTESAEEPAAEAVEAATEDVEAIAVEEGVMLEKMADTPVIYPGCEGTHEEIRACSINKLKSFLKTEFNKDLAEGLNLKDGEHKIRVFVKVDKSGKVSILRAYAKEEGLKKEAIRLIGELPQMVPATKDGEAVDTSFTIPFNFKIES